MSDARSVSGSTKFRDEPRILLFAGRFFLRGSSAYTLRLAEHLPDLGFQVSVVCPNARTVEAEQRKTLGIVEYPYLQAPIWGRVVREMLARELADDPPDLIHIQSRNAIPQGLWLARRLRVPVIQTVHDYLQPRERLKFDQTLTKRVLAVSESVKTDLIGRCGLPDDFVTVIHSGVACHQERAERDVLSAGRVPVVGTAGPLEAVKGFPFFLGAASRVLSTGREVEFVIAGAGPEEENLRRLARELDIAEHVTFVPNLLDFSEALEAMDIFCLPSLQQGIGTIMLEAMALGRPVIATRVGGVYRVIRDDETGLLVPPSDSAKLAERILELLDDPARARRIGDAARLEVQQEFRVDQMVQKTADVYREILGLTAPTPTPSAEIATVS